jgi:WD40 repeat protein/serine/threonine protein kinase
MSASKSKATIVLELAEQFLQRYRRGERPSLQAIIDQYPELAAEIREIVTALALLENIVLTDDSAAARPPVAVAEEKAQGQGTTTDPQPPAALQQLGDYRIIREIGRGGMGIVYEAEQVSLGRQVALKVLPRKMLLDAQQKRRFEREARAAAKLHHTNIVPVFGVGEHEGMPYYVMQFIPGLGLDAVLKELSRLHREKAPTVKMESKPPASPPAVAPVEVAHSLLTGRLDRTAAFQSDPQTPGSAEGSSPSQGSGSEAAPFPASLSGSSEIMSFSTSSVTLPGQAESPQPAHARKHTYWQSVAAIGVQVANALAHAHNQGILHRDIKPSNLLLDTHGTVWITDFGLAKADDHQDLTHVGDVVGTLRYMPPEAFEGRTDGRGDTYALGLTLYELAALRPAFDARDRHQLIKQVTSREPTRLSKRNPAVPRDLETIVHKAADRDITCRYRSAGELAADLQRFIDDEPIQARRTSLLERLARWARHNKGVAAALAVIVVLLAAVALASTAGVVLLTAANQREHLARKDESQARQEMEKERDEARHNLYVANMNLAQREWESGNVGHVHELLAECAPRQPGDKDLRGWEWFYQDRLCHGDLRTLRGHVGPARGAAYSPDGAWLATVGEDGTLRIWDVASGQAMHVLKAHAGWAVGVAYRPDGKQLATAGSDGKVRLWDTSSWAEARVLDGHSEAARSVVYSTDGARLAAASRDGAIQLWDSATGKALCTLPGHTPRVTAVAFSPDGNRLASAGADGTVRIWDLNATGSWRVLHGHRTRATGVAFSPDGARLVTASEDGTVRLWDTTTGREVRVLKGLAGSVLSVAFSPDGLRLAAGAYDGTARVWSAVAGDEPTLFRGHTGGVLDVAYSPDGTQLVTAGEDGAVRLWNAAGSVGPLFLRGHAGRVLSLAFSPDGLRLASAGWDSTLRIWATPPGGQGHPLLVRQDRALSVAFHPDGTRLATGGEDGVVRIWDLIEGVAYRTLQGHKPPVFGVAYSPDGTRLASAGGDGTVRIWDLAGGQEVRILKGHTGEVECLTYNADGTRLASCGEDGTVRVWDAQSGGKLWSVAVTPTGLAYVAYSADGAWLALACRDGRVRVLDAADGSEIRVFKGHTGWVSGVALSPDGTRLTSSGHDRTMRVWEAHLGRELRVFQGHAGWGSAAAYSPDGWRVASGGFEGTIALADGRPWSPEQQLEDEARGLAEGLFERPLLKADVLARLRSHKGISDTVRQRALEWAGHQEDEAERFDRASWEVVRHPDATPAQYRLALGWAQTACKLAAGRGVYHTTAGVALYRLGRFPEALSQLNSAVTLKEGSPPPIDLAFLALTHFRLGHVAEAKADLERLRAVLKSVPGGSQDEVLTFLPEAEAMVR